MWSWPAEGPATEQVPRRLGSPRLQNGRPEAPPPPGVREGPRGLAVSPGPGACSEGAPAGRATAPLWGRPGKGAAWPGGGREDLGAAPPSRRWGRQGRGRAAGTEPAFPARGGGGAGPLRTHRGTVGSGRGKTGAGGSRGCGRVPVDGTGRSPVCGDSALSWQPRPSVHTSPGSWGGGQTLHRGPHPPASAQSLLSHTCRLCPLRWPWPGLLLAQGSGTQGIPCVPEASGVGGGGTGASQGLGEGSASGPAPLRPRPSPWPAAMLETRQ